MGEYQRVLSGLGGGLHSTSCLLAGQSFSSSGCKVLTAAKYVECSGPPPVVDSSPSLLPVRLFSRVLTGSKAWWDWPVVRYVLHTVDAPRPAPRLHVVGVVRQVVLQSVGERQILDLPRRPVDGDATEVLQRRRGRVHGFGEQQLHRAVGRRRRGLRVRRRLVAGSGQLDVVLHQVDHAVKLLQLRLHQNHRVQLEFTVFVLDSQVGRTRWRHGGYGEQVISLRAVPHQEGALRGVLEDLFGLVSSQTAPVPAWQRDRTVRIYTGNSRTEPGNTGNYVSPWKRGVWDTPVFFRSFIAKAMRLSSDSTVLELLSPRLSLSILSVDSEDWQVIGQIQPSAYS